MTEKIPWELEGNPPNAQETPTPAMAFVGALLAVSAIAAMALALFM